MVVAVNRVGIRVLISTLFAIIWHYMRGGQKAPLMLAVLNGDTGAVRRVGAWKKTSGVFMQDDLFKFPSLAVIPALIHERNGMERRHENHDLASILINHASA